MDLASIWRQRLDWANVAYATAFGCAFGAALDHHCPVVVPDQLYASGVLVMIQRRHPTLDRAIAELARLVQMQRSFLNGRVV